MKYCKECHVKITTPAARCPLCKANIISIEGSTEQQVYPELLSKSRLQFDPVPIRPVSFFSFLRHFLPN